MSANVILNNVVYNGIETLKLPLADGSGFATFAHDGSEPTPGPTPTPDPIIDLSQYGSFTFTDPYSNYIIRTSVSAGNRVHVEIEKVEAGRTGVVMVMDDFSISKDTPGYEMPKVFDIPAGHVTLKVKNIVNTSGNIFDVGVKKPLSRENIVLARHADYNPSGMETSVDLANGEDVGAVFLNVCKDNAESEAITLGIIEFDIELYVDDVRYI